MILKRKIYGELLHWKNNKSNECLMLYGPRQVGKTTIIQQLGKNEYKSFIEINFIKNPNLINIFRSNDDTKVELSSENILKRITAYINNVNIIPNNTLIFIDEIQKCGEARTALKFLAEDKRYHVIASGSLLGLAYGTDDDKDVNLPDSIPVGFEKPLTMYSLDFEEFLWAKGYDDKKISYLLELFKSNSKVPHEINEKYEELFREFIVVGGMPEVVANFVENNDFSKVQAIQDKIMTSYYSDISLHAKGIEKVKVRKCFESIPRQLAKENKKFQYSKVESGKTSRYFSDSIQWLKDSGLVNVSHNVTQPYIPLGANEIDENFKLYYHDTGLLCSTYGFETKLAILNNTIKGNSKGGIYENVIGELLVKKGYSLRYKKEENNTLEIEFLIEQNGEVIPIEVKASNGSTFSLNDYINKWSPTICYKLISGNIGLTDKKKSIPHYMIMFI